MDIITGKNTDGVQTRERQGRHLAASDRGTGVDKARSGRAGRPVECRHEPVEHRVRARRLQGSRACADAASSGSTAPRTSCSCSPSRHSSASALLPRDKRRGVQRVGLAITISMAVTLLAYRAGRSFYISSLPAEVTHPDAATAAFDIITRYVERGIQTLLAPRRRAVRGRLAARPVPAATRLRALVATAAQPRLGRARRGRTRSGRVVDREHRNELRFAVVALAVIALLLWDQPDRTGRAPAHAADGSGVGHDLGDRRRSPPRPRRRRTTANRRRPAAPRSDGSVGAEAAAALAERRP